LRFWPMNSPAWWARSRWGKAEKTIDDRTTGLAWRHLPKALWVDTVTLRNPAKERKQKGRGGVASTADVFQSYCYAGPLHTEAGDAEAAEAAGSVICLCMSGLVPVLRGLWLGISGATFWKMRPQPGSSPKVCSPSINSSPCNRFSILTGQGYGALICIDQYRAFHYKDERNV